MNLMVNPVITGFRQEVDGTIKELKLGEAKEDAYANIIEQGSADLENNKAATINVSTYTSPVEVTPTSGKDGMKKATITLSNIPSGQTLYMWGDETEEVTYNHVILPVGTFAEITEGMNGIGTTESSGFLWEGTISEDTGAEVKTFDLVGENYSISGITSEWVATPLSLS